jgi:hypothetical protein
MTEREAKAVELLRAVPLRFGDEYSVAEWMMGFPEGWTEVKESKH